MARSHGSRSSLAGKTLLRALNVFEEFSSSEEELGITELSKRLSLHKNNVFRLLSTLQAKGYVEQNRLTGNYHLGRRVFVLGQRYIHRMGLLRQARPTMQSIVTQCNESCALAIPREGKAVFLDAIQGSRTVRVASRIGHQIPLYATAFGRVLLQMTTEEEIRKLLKDEPLPPTAAKPAPTPAVLADALAACRRNGYAVVEGEFEAGVSEVAAPIFDYGHRIVASVGLLGPSPRFTPELVREKFLPVLLEGAREISGRLGYP